MAANIIKIICIGNALHGDDGLGFAVFQRLQQQTLPEHVALINGATGGLALIPLFRQCSRVILVDLIRSAEEPGTLVELSHIDAKQAAGIEAGSLSSAGNLSYTEHGGDLPSLLQLLPLYVENVPQIDVLGIVGQEIDNFQPELSQPVANALPELCQRVLALAGD